MTDNTKEDMTPVDTTLGLLSGDMSILDELFPSLGNGDSSGSHFTNQLARLLNTLGSSDDEGSSGPSLFNPLQLSPPRLSEIHALATASLISQTQEAIMQEYNITDFDHDRSCDAEITPNSVAVSNEPFVQDTQQFSSKDGKTQEIQNGTKIHDSSANTSCPNISTLIGPVEKFSAISENNKFCKKTNCWTIKDTCIEEDRFSKVKLKLFDKDISIAHQTDNLNVLDNQSEEFDKDISIAHRTDNLNVLQNVDNQSEEFDKDISIAHQADTFYVLDNHSEEFDKNISIAHQADNLYVLDNQSEEYDKNISTDNLHIVEHAELHCDETVRVGLVVQNVTESRNKYFLSNLANEINSVNILNIVEQVESNLPMVNVDKDTSVGQNDKSKLHAVIADRYSNYVLPPKKRRIDCSSVVTTDSDMRSPDFEHDSIGMHKHSDADGTQENSKNRSNIISEKCNKRDKDKERCIVFVCVVCKKQFGGIDELANHSINHQQYSCPYPGCVRTFAYRSTLSYHRQTHEGQRNYQCATCGKVFTKTQHLEVHMRTHSDSKPFLCSVCNKGFTTTGNLRNHSRIHTGDRPYVCDVHNCSKSFAEIASLKKHKITHTGEKSFKCDYCGKCFSQASSRGYHMKKHR